MQSCRLEMADKNWNIYPFIFILRNQIHAVNYSIDLVLFQRRYSLKWTDRCRKRVSSWRILEDKSKWCERKWRKMRGSVPFMTNISKFISRTSNLRMTGSLPRWWSTECACSCSHYSFSFRPAESCLRHHILLRNDYELGLWWGWFG